MNKYLLEILQESNTIIIPGLGALTITNKDTGEAMFMSYLKHDDGALSSYIAQKDSVDEIEAKNTIAGYVREIQAKLDQGESFDVFGLGSFSKDSSGDIHFVSSLSKVETARVEPKKEEIVLEKVATKPAVEIEKKKEESVIEEFKSSEKEDLDQIVIPPVEEEPIEKKIVKTTVKEPIAEVKNFAIDQKEELSKNIEKHKALKEKAKKPIDKDVKLSYPMKEEKKKKRGVGFWILLLLLFLLIGGGTYFGLNYDSLKHHVPFLADVKEDSPKQEANTESEDAENAKESELANDQNSSNSTNGIEEVTGDETDIATEEEVTSIPEEKEVEVKPASSSTPSTASNTSSTGPYKVICGVFSEAANAERMAENLRNEGLSPELMLAPSGNTFVSMKGFESEKEAKIAVSDLRSIAPKAWVMFKP